MLELKKMIKKYIFIQLVAIAFFISFFSCYAEENTDLLNYYSGDVKLPDELYKTYQNLIETIATGDAGDINQYCLPQSVTFTYGMRKNREYGQDINIPFLKNNFDKYIRNIRKEAEGCYLIRTGTSALWFIYTKHLGWKLYRYLDKPIS
jgi:hypothetical protein